MKKFLIVGLGNPGSAYSLTRHNVGFRLIDILSREWQIEVKQNKFKGQYGIGQAEGQKVILLKPQTFMNLSGESVVPFLNWYQVPQENLIVIYDDLDLPLGKIRIRAKGSSGGHNGLKSIIAQLGSQEFSRVRVGIGKSEQIETVNWVLSRFAS
ncbi:MAG: aminoacyl-tRNA hydrolase, partial [Clostridia bacterium]|nr:aminoacyl-tRNA hydrolase [Clostridia bacterium]